MTRGTWFCAFLALLACSDSKSPPTPTRSTSLLGNKSDVAINHFESTCDGRLYRGVRLYCHLSGDTDYSIEFDKLDRTRVIEICATQVESLKIFERAFAEILPEEVREVIRQSIVDYDPARFRYEKPGSRVWLFAGGWKAKQGWDDPLGPHCMEWVFDEDIPAK